jgi:hypothetical protein
VCVRERERENTHTHTHTHIFVAGSHDTLLAREGAYTKLVSKQLEHHAAHAQQVMQGATPAHSSCSTTTSISHACLSGGGSGFKTPELEIVRDRARERAMIPNAAATAPNYVTNYMAQPSGGRARPLAPGKEQTPGRSVGREWQGGKDDGGVGLGVNGERSPGSLCESV